MSTLIFADAYGELKMFKDTSRECYFSLTRETWLDATDKNDGFTVHTHLDNIPRKSPPDSNILNTVCLNGIFLVTSGDKKKQRFKLFEKLSDCPKNGYEGSEKKTKNFSTRQPGWDLKSMNKEWNQTNG